MYKYVTFTCRLINLHSIEYWNPFTSKVFRNYLTRMFHDLTIIMRSNGSILNIVVVIKH